MNTNLAEKEIRNNIQIDQQKIIIAKNFIMNQDAKIDIPTSLDKFTTSQGYPKVDQIIIHDSVPIEEQIKKASGYISWYVSYSQAILELIHSNYLIPTSQQLFPYGGGLSINWTTVVPGSGGMSSSWNFGDFIVMVPSALKKTYVYTNQQFTLFDAGLFISHLGIKQAHQDVIEALSDTISCFRKELYRPALTMLGKATEGAWIELGISLSNFAIKKGIDVEKNTQLIDKLMGPDSFVFKVDKVTNLYASHFKDWFNELRIKTNIQPFHLQEIRLWTDVVRESRNAIHFGAKLNFQNNYEKTAIILLASISHFKTIYLLKTAADSDL